MTIRLRERDFAAQVVHLAALRDWMIYRTWLSLHSPAGFPDLFLLRGDRIVTAELKSAKGVLSPAQLVWLDALRATGKVEVFLWRPADWDEIERTLE